MSIAIFTFSCSSLWSSIYIFQIIKSYAVYYHSYMLHLFSCSNGWDLVSSVAPLSAGRHTGGGSHIDMVMLVSYLANFTMLNYVTM